jgi:hypothetical protein
VSVYGALAKTLQIEALNKGDFGRQQPKLARKQLFGFLAGVTMEGRDTIPRTRPGLTRKGTPVRQFLQSRAICHHWP